MSRRIGILLCGLTMIVFSWPQDSVCAIFQGALPQNTSAQTTQYIITFKAKYSPDMDTVIEWFDTQKLGVYIRPMFTVQSVGPSFVGKKPDWNPAGPFSALKWQPWKAPQAFAQTPYRTRPAGGGPQVLGRVVTAGSAPGGGYWQSSQACGTQFPVAPGLSINNSNTVQFPVDQCNTDPHYTTGIMPPTIPGNPALFQDYTLVNLPAGYTCAGWQRYDLFADTGISIGSSSGSGCSTTVQAGTPVINVPNPYSTIDHHVWFFINPPAQAAGSTNPVVVPAPEVSSLGETGTPCIRGVANQCGISNILVCDASPIGITANGICKIPQCVGKQCVSTAPIPSTFVSGELENVYAVAVFGKEPAASGLISTTNVPQTTTLARSLLQAFPDTITSVEPDRKLHFQQQPDDPYFSQQWSIPAIGADIATSGDGSVVKIAVIDTGVAAGHEDFPSRTLLSGRDYAICDLLGDANECAVKRTCPMFTNGYCRDDAIDDNGHGTHIAGTIAAGTNNTKGVAGLVSAAQIIPVKVLNAGGETLESWTFEGIIYAVHQGAKVVNFSIGGCASMSASGTSCPHDTTVASPGLKKVLDYAIRRGVVVVVASGNENDDAQWYTPVNYNKTPKTAGKILVVGATNRQIQRASYSNYGDVVDVAAPGGDIIADFNGDGSIGSDDCTTQECILSTYLIGGGHRFSDPHYENYAGTSMAAPHVAAAAGLLLGKNPLLSPQEIIEVIKTSTNPITADHPIGGQINVGQALAQVKEASNIHYVDPQCDLCGWCNPLDDPKPVNWDSCRSCLYDAAGNRTNTSYTVLGCVEATSGEMVQTILRVVLGTSGGIAFLAFLFGSYAVMTAGGNPSRITMGKETIISAVVGLFVVLFSVFILRLLGFTLFQIPGFA